MIKQEIVFNNITTRRTIKPENYTGEIINDKAIWEILEKANWAPTHGYTEPWRFVVFSAEGKTNFAKDHAELYKSETSEEKFKQVKFDKIIKRAETTSHLVAIVMKRGENPKIPVWEEICATACAVQNIMLAANSMGIATYWNSGGMTNSPKMKEYLGFEEVDQVLGFLYMGISAINIPIGRRITEIEKKVDWR